MATLSSYSTRFGDRWRAIDPAWRWAVGVYAAARCVYTLWGLVILLVVPSVAQNLVLLGEPVLAAIDFESGERFVYSRKVGEQVLTFRETGEGLVTDAETGSVWSLREGKAVRGPLTGRTLGAGEYTAEQVFPYKGAEPARGWLGMWQRFDVLWYQAIAERGYGANAGDIHFPPLYPLLVSAAGRALGGGYFFAGWLIAQVALVASLGLLFQMTAARWDGQTARRAVVFTILFPTAFFFFTVYAEALFLLWSLLCFRSLGRKEWAWAGFFVFLAILTRLQGVALMVPLTYCVWWEWQTEKRVGMAHAFMLGVPLLACAFYLGMRALAGEASIVPTHEPQLNARLAMPWDNVVYAVQTIAAGIFLTADILNLAATVGAVVILARGWRMLPREMALYAAATIVVVMLRYVDTQPLNSMTRYLLTLFPLTMALAVWSKNRWVERAVVYGFAPLNLYLCAQFLTWGWVA
jgi:hypothetical protein